MALPPPLMQRLVSVRTWIALGVLAPVGMLVISGAMLWDMRRDAYTKAEQTTINLLQVIERDIDHNVELFDLSLRAAAHNIQAPGLDAVSPALRQLILFDRAATAQDMGVMFILDERGDIAVDEGAVPPRRGNYADREYFKVQKARADLGLFIGAPIISRFTGEPMLPFSRRIEKADGSFGGVAFSSLKLSYFSHLFAPLALGQDGSIDLYLRDGTRIVRHPQAAAEDGKAPAQAIAGGRQGTFVAVSPRDGIERHYAFTQIGDWPLVLTVALSTREIEAAWRTKALVIGGIVLVLCGLTVILSLLYGRDLRRRAALQAELARLSRTDPLTGLPNRRRFEQTLDEVWREAVRSASPVSMLIVDADHFKRINDRYGHPVGDAVLKGLGSCLSAGVHRPRDLVCRIGGEEFAVLLPDTDRAGASRVAAGIHRRIRALSIASTGIRAGSLTVSIGLATGPQDGDVQPEDLYRRADAALYEAKANGRDQTRCASDAEGRERVLRLVGG
jgi:diguanylate cyclase (GGDEF)-like protein